MNAAPLHRCVLRYPSPMSTTLERIFDDLKTLSAEDRSRVADFLEFGFADEPATDADTDAAWEQELSSRVRDIEEGKVELFSHEEVTRGLDAIFARHGVVRHSHSA